MTLVLRTILLFVLSTSFSFAQDLKADALKLWGKRDEKESLLQAIKKFQELHKAHPKDIEILVYLTRCHFLLADSHTESKDDKKELFEKAFTYGDEALSLNETYAARLKKGDDPEFMVSALGINEVPAMYWTAASIGKYARATGIFASLKYKSKIIALVSRVEKLQPDFFYGSVPRYWGSYYALIPRMAGKDLKKSKEYFAKAAQMGPAYLGNMVLKAETYYVEKENEKAFKETLQEVINTTTYDNHPELGPENRMEKVKAKALLAKIKDLF